MITIGAVQPSKEYPNMMNWQYHDTLMNDNEALKKLSNLVKESHDWKNIQEVVRLAFLHVSDALHTQDSKLHYLISELNSKSTKHELDTKLSNKPSHAEMDKLFSDLVSKIDSKMDATDSILTGIIFPLKLFLYSPRPE